MSAEITTFTPRTEQASEISHVDAPLEPQEQLTQPLVAYELVNLGKRNGRNGRDVRMAVPRGQAVITELPHAQDARYAAIFDRVAPGMQRFDNYPYDVYIQDSKLITCRSDFIGNETCYFDIYALGGGHAGNGVGEYIPSGKAWNNANGEGNPPEAETRMIAQSSSHVWSQSGEFVLKVLNKHNGSLGEAKRMRDKLAASENTKKNNLAIQDRVANYNERIKPISREETVVSLAGD